MAAKGHRGKKLRKNLPVVSLQSTRSIPSGGGHSEFGAGQMSVSSHEGKAADRFSFPPLATRASNVVCWYGERDRRKERGFSCQGKKPQSQLCV